MASNTQKVLGAVVVAGLGAALWWSFGRPQKGFITAMMAIDGEHAVFTMRHNPDNGPATAWVGVIGREGVQWSAELPALTYSVYARHGLTVADGQLTIKVSDTDSFAQVLAFDLESGERRWSAGRIEFAASEYDSMLHVVRGARPAADGELLLHGDHDRNTARLVAREAATGAQRWAQRIAPDAVVLQLEVTPRWVIYRTEDTWEFVRRDNGQVGRSLDLYTPACIDEHRFVAWSRGRLVEVDLDADDLPLYDNPLAESGRVRSCGVHDHQFVFTVVHERVSDTPRTELIGVDLESAAVAWRFELGAGEPSTIARSRDNSETTADPLRGEMSDYVPVLMDVRGNDTHVLAVADLQGHRVAWTSEAHRELLHYQVFRGSAQQHFVAGLGRLAAIDGRTGKLTAAVELRHEDLRHFNAVDGKLWVHTMAYGTMSSLPWLVLDGATLAVHQQGESAYLPLDATEAFGRWLKPSTAKTSASR